MDKELKQSDLVALITKALTFITGLFTPDTAMARPAKELGIPVMWVMRMTPNDIEMTSRVLLVTESTSGPSVEVALYIELVTRDPGSKLATIQATTNISWPSLGMCDATTGMSVAQQLTHAAHEVGQVEMALRQLRRSIGLADKAELEGAFQELSNTAAGHQQACRTYSHVIVAR